MSTPSAIIKCKPTNQTGRLNTGVGAFNVSLSMEFARTTLGQKGTTKYGSARQNADSVVSIAVAWTIASKAASLGMWALLV